MIMIMTLRIMVSDMFTRPENFMGMFGQYAPPPPYPIAISFHNDGPSSLSKAYSVVWLNRFLHVKLMGNYNRVFFQQVNF